MDIDTSAKEDVPLADFVEDFPKHFLIKAERWAHGGKQRLYSRKLQDRSFPEGAGLRDMPW